MNQINGCKKGNHDLIEIYRVHNIYGEDQVVRWCRVCGSVVVDIEVDGRIMAGSIMKMIAPETFRSEL